jgi:hypothetical protein
VNQIFYAYLVVFFFTVFFAAFLATFFLGAFLAVDFFAVPFLAVAFFMGKEFTPFRTEKRHQSEFHSLFIIRRRTKNEYYGDYTEFGVRCKY